MSKRGQFQVEVDEHCERTMSGEQRLLRYVILQAFRDARQPGLAFPRVHARSRFHEREAQEAREQALAWFKNAGADYRFICGAAGVDPDETRSNVFNILASSKKDNDNGE